jgi:hypothetical protein
MVFIGVNEDCSRPSVPLLAALKNQIKTSLKGKLFDYLYRVQGPLEPPYLPLAGGHLFSEEGR